MKVAKDKNWRLVLDGEDRGEFAKALRGSRWEKIWHNHVDPHDDEDLDQGYVLSLEIPDLETLIDALSRLGHLRPTFGMGLFGSAGFETVVTRCFLANEAYPFEPAGFTLESKHNSGDKAIQDQMENVENAVEQLRMVIAERGAL